MIIYSYGNIVYVANRNDAHYLYTMTNILIFLLGGIFTGIVFGAAFLSVTRTLQKETLRNHMIIAAYGFLLFYIAGSAMASQAAYLPSMR